MLHDFFAGFIKVHVLYHASQAPICGVEISRELARHGYAVSPGTLYPSLHALERQGYLRSREAVVNGRRRRYYRITRKGRRALEESRGRIAELVKEVMEGRGRC